MKLIPEMVSCRDAESVPFSCLNLKTSSDSTELKQIHFQTVSKRALCQGSLRISLRSIHLCLVPTPEVINLGKHGTLFVNINDKSSPGLHGYILSRFSFKNSVFCTIKKQTTRTHDRETTKLKTVVFS